jgi:hypothetical protein
MLSSIKFISAVFTVSFATPTVNRMYHYHEDQHVADVEGII